MKVKSSQSENYYKDIFDNLNQALLIVDEHLRVEEMNDSAEEIFKISRKKARWNKTDLFLPVEIEDIALKSLKDNRIVQGDEIDCRLKGGNAITLLVNSIPFQSSYQGSKSVILQIQDMSLNKIITKKN